MVVDIWPTLGDILEYEILSVLSYFKNVNVTLKNKKFLTSK